MPQNRECCDGCGFSTEDEVAEGDAYEASLLGQYFLFGCEIAFGADEDGDG